MTPDQKVVTLEQHRENLLAAQTFDEYKQAHIKYIDLLIKTIPQQQKTQAALEEYVISSLGRASTGQEIKATTTFINWVLNTFSENSCAEDPDERDYSGWYKLKLRREDLVNLCEILGWLKPNAFPFDNNPLEIIMHHVNQEPAPEGK